MCYWSNIAKHAWSFDHRIDFDNSSVICIGKGTFRFRKTFKVWHTSATKNADNNSKPILNQHSILFEYVVFSLFLSRLFLHIFTRFAFHFLFVEGCGSTLRAEPLFSLL